MLFIFLNDKQTKQLFINKYLELDNFITGTGKRSNYNSFQFYKEQAPLKTSESQIVFLSQFISASIFSKNDKNNYNRNYDIPLGFLKDGLSDKKVEINFGDDKEIFIDHEYMSIRRSLLNSFLASYDSNSEDFNTWFTFFRTLDKFPEIFVSLLSIITDLKEFPQISITPQFAKSTKIELQFIYFGRVLAETYFKENNNKTDDIHKNWLMHLNPERKIQVLPIPDKFIADSDIIIGYILALHFSSSTKNISMSDAKLFLVNAISNNSNIKNQDQILFYCFLWLGLLNQKLNNYFHTKYSIDILYYIESNSYILTKNLDKALFPEIMSSVVSDLMEPAKIKNKSKSKSFSEYCLMLSGESPKEFTEKEVITKIQPYNLRSKKVLLYFFRNDSSLKDLWILLQSLNVFQNILLIYMHDQSLKDQDIIMERDLELGKIKSKFVKEFSKIDFQIITKNVSDPDNSDIINNLKGYMSKYCNENNFVYLSDSVKTKDLDTESIWIGSAFSKTPIYNSGFNYLFINSLGS